MHQSTEISRNVNLKKLVIELCRGFLEKTLCVYFGPNNRVQIISVKDAIDKIKARQFSAGYKKPLLTRREVQIMEGLVRGKINKEIASELRLSTNTVRNHLRSIFTKLCVENRTEAIVRYLSENVKPRYPSG